MVDRGLLPNADQNQGHREFCASVLSGALGGPVFPRRSPFGRPNCESFSRQSFKNIPVATMHGRQVVLVDCAADRSAQTRSCILVGSKMNSAINASIRDVVGNLVE